MVFVNPFVPLGDPYQPAESYITLSEYQTSAAAVDTANLQPGGGPGANAAVLVNKIAVASGWANLLCHQTLAATVDNETSNGPLLVRRDGYVYVPVRYWPVLQVNSFQAGWRPSTMTAITNPQDMWMVSRTVIAVPLNALTPSSALGSFPLIQPGNKVFCEWQYVNGWPNALLTATVAAGATSLPLSNTLGFVAGRTYKIFDVLSGNPETFTCTSTPTGSRTGPGSIGCTALAAAHTLPSAPDGIAVSGMPDEMRQAVAFLTSQTIKARGAEAIVLASFGGTPHTKVAASEAGFEDLASAIDLLERYDRVPL